MFNLQFKIKFIGQEINHSAFAYDSNNVQISSLKYGIHEKYLDVKMGCYVKSNNLIDDNLKCFLILNGEISDIWVWARSNFTEMKNISNDSYHALMFRDYVDKYDFSKGEFEFTPKWVSLGVRVQASDFGFKENTSNE